MIFNWARSTVDAVKYKINQSCLDKHDEVIAPGWQSFTYSSLRFRRAHCQIIDRAEDRNIYIAHFNIFPHFNDPSPIFGFDIVCGPNKVTGAFYDFSMPGYPMHKMSAWFHEHASKYEWSRPRQLPPWAQKIFSDDMVAAGNIHNPEELSRLDHAVREGLGYYCENVGLSQESLAEYHLLQNLYCRYQKQNPRVLDSMLALGYGETLVKNYIDRILFPEITCY